MVEETVNTVKTSSDGTVKLSIEKYQELCAKAAEKAPIVYRTIQKTPAVAAGDNMLWGGSLMGVGVGVALLGGMIYFIGRRQKAAL